MVTNTKRHRDYYKGVKVALYPCSIRDQNAIADELIDMAINKWHLAKYASELTVRECTLSDMGLEDWRLLLRRGSCEWISHTVPNNSVVAFYGFHLPLRNTFDDELSIVVWKGSEVAINPPFSVYSLCPPDCGLYVYSLVKPHLIFGPNVAFRVFASTLGEVDVELELLLMKVTAWEYKR